MTAYFEDDTCFWSARDFRMTRMPNVFSRSSGRPTAWRADVGDPARRIGCRLGAGVPGIPRRAGSARDGIARAARVRGLRGMGIRVEHEGRNVACDDGAAATRRAARSAAARAPICRRPAMLVAQSHHIDHCNDCSDRSIPASYYFRLDLNDSALTTVLSDGERCARAGAARAIVASRHHHAPRHACFQAKLARRHGRRRGRWPPPNGVRIPSSAIRSAGRSRRIGVVSESKRYVAAFAAKLAEWELLPPSLAKQAGVGHLVAITVRDEKSNVLYRSPGNSAISTAQRTSSRSTSRDSRSRPHSSLAWPAVSFSATPIDSRCCSRCS